MKRKLIIITMVAMVATACSTGLQTTGGYVDDIYYRPGDVSMELSPELADNELANKKQLAKKETIIVSQLEEGEDGTKKLNNYIYADDEPDWFNKVQAYNLENIDSVANDTVYFPDEDQGQYEINNYFVEDDFSYAQRIRTFHDPYYYHYDPYYNFSFRWGWGSPHYSYWDPWYYDPWYYGSWGYAGAYWGWYGYNSWYPPYYHNHYYPYYGSYYNNWPYYAGNNRDYHDGDRRSRRPNTVYGGGGVAARSVGSSDMRQSGSVINKSAQSNGRRSVIDNTTASNQKSVTTQRSGSGEALIEMRRSTTTSNVSRNGNVRTNNTSTAPASTRTAVTPVTRSERSGSASYNKPVVSSGNANTQRSSDYTPSYNKPRSNTRATYNRSNSTPAQSRSTYTRSTGSSSKSYSIPSSTTRSTPTSTYRSGSSGSSSRSYSSSPSRSSYSAPSRSSSTPSRSSSSYSPSRSSSGSSGSSYSRSSGSSSSGSSSSSSSSSGGSRGSRR
ncbi:hypothetical protein [Roseimarinus sediminis]|uniref:hypothetical protein n=1 Tax=Roseimarinus sediminis TaxID=1610899 RepID=UPI003D1C7560